MSDPYPEVNGDESGIVPNQSARASEWPKKIRTLTAAELDRLTIDGSGRFYWDGKLVTYDPPAPPKPQQERRADTLEPSALATLDRAEDDGNERKAPEPIEGAEIPGSVEARARRDDMRAVDLDNVATVPPPVAPVPELRAPAVVDEAALVAPALRMPERMRLSLSRWQSLGAIIVVLGVLIGASGMAAYGFVVAHDWGCRTGMITSYCPPNPAARPPAPVRPDIPA